MITFHYLNISNCFCEFLFILLTGKCDQRVCKNKDKGMMYRPCWFEDMDGVKGTSKAMVQSKDGRLLALSSEDGYLFIYNVESGYPIGQKAPATKHSASVSMKTILAGP